MDEGGRIPGVIELDQVEEELAQNVVQIDQLQQDLTESRNNAVEMQKNLESKIVSLQTVIGLKNQTIMSHIIELEEKEKEIEKYKIEIDANSKAMAVKDAKIRDLEAKLAEKEQKSTSESRNYGGCCEVVPMNSGLRSDEKVLPNHEEVYIDSHCHLDFIWEKKKFADMDVLRNRFNDAFPSTFKGCIANFIKPENWTYIDWIKTVAKDRQVLGTSFGVHPHHSGTVTKERLKFLKDLLINYRALLNIVAVGECGVDLSGKNDVSLEKQLEIFQYQVDLAHELDLPIIIHCRSGTGKDPVDDVYRILKKRPNHPIHFHCFNRSLRVAEKWMKKFPNCTFGFTPMVIHAEWFVPLAKRIPIARIHLETDAPYFKPDIEYSAFSQPANYSLPGAAVTVAVRISDITGIPLDDVIEASRRCTERIYRLPKE